MGNPISDYSTDYRRTKTFVSKGMVEAKEIAIGAHIDSRSAATRTTLSTTQYVPLLQTLQLLFSKEEFRKTLQNDKE